MTHVSWGELDQRIAAIYAAALPDLKLNQARRIFRKADQIVPEQKFTYREQWENRWGDSYPEFVGQQIEAQRQRVKDGLAVSAQGDVQAPG